MPVFMKFKGIILFLCVFFACRKESFYSDSSARLNFSSDTVLFDTVFTNMLTANKILMVYNPYPKAVKISSIRLCGGSTSFYKINVNGISGYEFKEIEIFPRDSLYIFVAAKLDEVGQDKPLIVKDSLLFTLNGNIQKVLLISYGQDVYVFKNNVLATQEWTAGKPYLIFGTVTVDSGQTLTMQAGTRVYMYNNANLCVKGSLVIHGTSSQRVLIQHTRLEPFYYNKAGQWGKIILKGSGGPYFIENTDIYSPVTGIEIGDTGSTTRPSLVLRNVQMVNAKLALLKSFGAHVTAINCVFANGGEGCVLLYMGGKYEFYHCTIVNYGVIGVNLSAYRLPALYYNDEYSSSAKGILDSLTVVNSIVYDGGVTWMDISTVSTNYYFKNCILKADWNKFNLSDPAHFDSVYYLLKDPSRLLVRPVITGTDYEKYKYDFMPDSLSDARKKASLPYAFRYPLDMHEKSRLDSLTPDIGALQWQPSKKK